MCAIMTPDHELAARKSVTLDECGASRLIYQGHSGSMQPFFGDEMEAFKSTHKPVVVSNTLAVLKRLLLRGVGIAFYTRLGFVEELANGRLVAVPLEGDRLSTAATVPDRPVRPYADRSPHAPWPSICSKRARTASPPALDPGSHR